MNGKPSLFSELRRRNVFRVALTYAVVAWLLLEIASVLLPMVDAPESIITAFVVLLALGFAVALFISWAFEMTPGGDPILEPSQVCEIYYRRCSYCLRSVCLSTVATEAHSEGFTERAGFESGTIHCRFTVGKREQHAANGASSS